MVVTRVESRISLYAKEMKNPAIIHFPTEDAFVEKFGRLKYVEGVLVPRIGEITNLISKVLKFG